MQENAPWFEYVFFFSFLADARCVAGTSGVLFARDVTCTSPMTRPASSWNGAWIADRLCKIRCLLQNSSAKLTPPTTLPTVRRGSSPGRPLWKILRELKTTTSHAPSKPLWKRKRKLLEVGCCAIDFLHAAQRAGWDVRAVEYSASLAEGTPA